MEALNLLLIVPKVTWNENGISGPPMGKHLFRRLLVCALLMKVNF